MLALTRQCPYCHSKDVDRVRRPFYVRNVLFPKRYYRCQRCMRHFFICPAWISKGVTIFHRPPIKEPS